MKLQFILNEKYYTKQGQEIELKRDEDAEGDSNRGWQVDQINAYIDGEEAGYLKIAYIPMKRFYNHYPNIFAWMGKINGKILVPKEKSSFNIIRSSGEPFEYKNYSRKEKREFLHNLISQVNVSPSISYKEEMKYIDQFKTDKELLQEIKRIEKELMNGVEGKRFKEFKNYYVDKPVVDFIKVYPEFQRQRIAESLYLEGAKWMKEKGLKLHASSSQSDAAKGTWQHLSKSHKVHTKRKSKKGRRYLDI